MRVHIYKRIQVCKSGNYGKLPAGEKEEAFVPGRAIVHLRWCEIPLQHWGGGLLCLTTNHHGARGGFRLLPSGLPSGATISAAFEKSSRRRVTPTTAGALASVSPVIAAFSRRFGSKSTCRGHDERVRWMGALLFTN